jgi:hypothetical protein
MNKNIYLIGKICKIYSLAVMMASLILIYLIFYRMLPHGVVELNAITYNEYWIEVVALILSIPGLVMIMINFYRGLYHNEVKI